MSAEKYKDGIKVASMTSQVVGVEHAVKLSPQMAADIQHLSQNLSAVDAGSISPGISHMRPPTTHGRGV